MNSKRYDGVYYPVRPITDLKDILVQSTEMFADQTAYLTKDKKEGRFVPITYRKVGEDYRALGTKFRSMGLHGKKIGVIGETRYEWILTYFAVVAGASVIVPLDKNLPQGELLGLIERSEMSALVFSDKCRKNVEPLTEEAGKEGKIQYFISMDQEEEQDGVLSFWGLVEDGRDLLETGETEYLDQVVDPDQMSTLLFTSGTTGMAKGVMISHRNIASNVYEMSKFFHIPEPGIVYSVLPIHHVYEMTCDIWTTFYQGKTLANCEGLKYILKDMQEVHPNVMLGVPLIFEKMYKGMLKQAKRRGEDEKLLRAIDLSKRLKLYRNSFAVKRMFRAIHSSFGGDIKAFVVGGAAADPKIIEDFEAMGFPMVQGYGMTENSPIVALNPDRYRKADAVGQPLPGTKIRVINQDEDGIGELIVKGPSVMMGYYQNEEATKEALQNGWLHTGDLGYEDADGFFHLTGRSKTVIVTKGGKNIFPEEVEDTILKNDLVKEVLVHGVPDERVGNVIVTADIFPDYSLLKEQQGEMTDSEVYHFYRKLIDDVNETMPPYKQVKRINIRKTEFTKTTTGKIKRYGNRLSAGEIASVDEGKGEYYAVNKIEEGRIRDLVEQIKQSDDPIVLHRDLEPVSTVKGILKRALEKYPTRIAFAQRFDESGDSAELSYEQAIADIEGLGTALINRGLSGKRIAILGNNTYSEEISFLSISAGVGSVVPIDRQLDPEEIRRQMRKVDCSAVIYDERCGDLMDEVLSSEEMSGVKRIVSGSIDESLFREEESKELGMKGVWSWQALVEEGKRQIGQGDRQYLDANVTGKDEAAVFFTSGVTGPAKAVGLTHMNLMADLISTASVLDIREDDTVYSVIPPNNIYQCALGILMPMYKGARIANFESVLSLEEDLGNSQPTVLLAEPVMMQEIYVRIEDEIKESTRPGRLDNIRQLRKIASRFNSVNPLRVYNRTAEKKLGGKMRLMISGGGKIDPEVLDFFNDLGITAIQGYGMTECGAVAAMNPDDSKLSNSGSCGHILPGIRIRIASSEKGRSGEICIKGRNVMNGYIGDEEKTNEVLQNEWFHTGDIGYLDDNGFLYIEGRLADSDSSEEE
ncbi:MAG: AMP-binding protein [Eubacteriales bacterium]|nr:AMP-binding protein [Eubacteriales bacterium]